MPDKDPPLITSKSPSMRRAREEWEHPSETADPEVVAALCSIVEVERATAAAYRAAGRDDQASRHEERADRVASIVSDLGGAAPGAEDIDPRSVPVSAEEVSYLSGHDVDGALERDEQAVKQAYDAALARDLGNDVAERLRSIRD